MKKDNNNNNNNNNDHFEKFTKEAKKVLLIAGEASKKSKTNYIGTEHILIGILSQQNSLGATVLANFGVSLENVNLVLKTVGRTASVSQGGKSGGTGGLSGFAKKVIENAVRSAHDYNHMFIGTEHLLFALVSQENTAATVILENMKVNTNDIKQEVLRIFENPKMAPKSGMPPQMMNPLEFLLSGLQGVFSGNEKNPYMEAQKAPAKQGAPQQQTKTPALDYFSSDLVRECREGKLNPVIGREAEIERMVSILQRKTKNNPVLIGEPGVGKTAVAEGLAHAIVKETTPDNLLDKRILSISLSAVVAGTKYRGEFEERMKQIVDEAASQDNIILFVDELHTVIGAGSAEGSLDAANILKPALSRGKIQMIGATTTSEYRKYIESDCALERRFQPVMVEESTEDETIDILNGIRESFEDHHNLLIMDEALKAAIKLSKRYINDRYLPDKAIDLIDEAASLKGIKSPKIASAAKKYQKELSKIIKRKEEAVSRQDYEYAAELRAKELELINLIDQSKTVKIPREKRDNVTEDDIGRVISNMTGIPVTKLIKTDVERLKNLEVSLHKRIVGQEEAVNIVSNAIRRSRAGISDYNRPIGSFIFMGPTGVGKTELVKTLAQEVYNDEHALIKIDMSEFMERHNTSRLVGATAGYVGYEEGGQLTEAVRKKPYSVVLFDEIEKAHPEVFNLLLQILEDGVLTDSKGRKVDFKNAIIVMTSNIGAEQLTNKAASIGFNLSNDELKEAEDDYNHKKDEILEKLHEHFRPEFLNRVDKVVVFQPLTHQNIKDIVRLQLGYLQDRLEHINLNIEATDGALEVLATLSYDPGFGARPVRRKIQDLIEDPLTEAILGEKFKDGDTVQVVKKGKEGVELKKKGSKVVKKKVSSKK